MAFDIQAAKQAGYSDGEIADYLASQKNFDAAGARKSGYSDPEIVAHLSGASTQPAPSFTDSLVRQLGLTGRAVLGGLGGVANTVLDPAVAGINNVAGTNLPIPSQAMERTLSRFLPEPQNAEERIVQAGARAMIPVAGSVQTGRAIPMLAPLAQMPGLQLASGVGGATASQGAAEAGFGPMGQMGVGLLGGVAGPTALAAGTAAARAALRVPGSLIAPFTESGRLNTAARVYQNAATDPRMAADSIINAPNYVPGVQPTAAELANDTGMSALYKTMRNQNPAPFASRDAANDTARQAFLSQKFGNQTDIAAAKVARDATTGPMRESAFANAGPVDTAPIVDSGTAALEAGAKYRGSGPMLQKFVSQISEISDPQVLYNGPRKAINDAIAGKLSQDNPLSQFTKQELIGLRGAIDDQIEKVAPGFKNYLSTHAGLSRQIDSQQLGQDIASASTNPQTERLSPAQFTRQVKNNAPDIAGMGAQGSDAMMRVNEDLKRSVAPANTMRTAGSDTTQNLVGAEMVNRLLGHAPGGMASRALGKVASVVYSPFEQQVRDLMMRGQMDPRFAASLLTRPIPQKSDLMSGLLAKRFPIAYGGLLGTMSAQ